MKLTSKLMILSLLACFSIFQLKGQTQYSDYKTMSQRVARLATDFPSLCSVKSLVKTAGGKDIWVVTVGTGEKDNKPAIAVVGGVDGGYILSRELSLGFAENLLKGSSDPSVKDLLGKITFYVFPDVSPDASEQYFAALKYERNVNTRPTDDDRDFSTNEDPCEDLNKDGYITVIRVSDPSGTLIESEEDKRVLVAADLSKGQKGMYNIFTEGIDNDKDGQFNEDGQGGVNFNKNFTYNYEEFGENAGPHAVSEPESKAVADFLFDHFNIYTTFTFGPQDNLGQPPRSSERAASTSSGGQGAGQGTGQFQMGGGRGSGSGSRSGDRRITSVMRTDETVIRLVSDKFHEITGIKGAPGAVPTARGNFMDWAYYHYGRYSFGTPGWWITADRTGNAEASFLKYAEENKLGDVFVPWAEIKHSDFPDKKVEVGGMKPFVMVNPPADKLPEIITGNYKFIVAVAEMHPELEFLDTNVESLGENIFRVTLKVHNKGIFATCAEVGDMNQWTRIMRISLEPAGGQNLLSGNRVQRMQRLEGGKTLEFTWLISGKGTLKVNAGALNVGTITKNIELK